MLYSKAICVWKSVEIEYQLGMETSSKKTLLHISVYCTVCENIIDRYHQNANICYPIKIVIFPILR